MVNTMNYFLVDYENVNASGLKGVSGLSEEDTVVIFYSEKAETLTFGLHRRLNESKATISFQRVQTGVKNALDFQLCTYLGYLVGQNAQSPAVYYIVSADQDYALICSYWTRRKVNVSLISEISATAAPADSVPTVPETPPPSLPLKQANITAEEISTLLKDLLPAKYKAHIPAVAEIIRNGRTKQAVHGELMKTFHQGTDNTVPNEMYQSVKPLLLSNTEYLHVQLWSLLPAKYKSYFPAVAEIVQRCKEKQAVYTEVSRAFHQGGDSSIPGEIYRSIKPLLTDKT